MTFAIAQSVRFTYYSWVGNGLPIKELPESADSAIHARQATSRRLSLTTNAGAHDPLMLFADVVNDKLKSLFFTMEIIVSENR